MSIEDILYSKDPLSIEALQMLINYREEDMYVDYKELIEHNNNKSWLELTKDVMAFANTNGGYIVFGVRYKPFSVVGLEDKVVEFLTDTNNVLQKINRYIAPDVTNMRTKKFNTIDGTIVVLYIPESKGKTHVVIKEGSYKHSSGHSEIILRPGMIYMRRSATNQILTSDDLEYILAKRIEYYKETIFNKIIKVMEAPIEKEILFVDGIDDAMKVKLSNDADAIPIKGLPITKPPENDQEEVSVWIAMKLRDPLFSPRPERLWYIYSKRAILGSVLLDDQIVELIKFNLLNEIPVFYWMQIINRSKCKDIIKTCFEQVKNFSAKNFLLRVGAFQGKTFYNNLLKKLGQDIKRLNNRSRTYPSNPSTLFHPELLKREGRGIKAKIISNTELEKRFDYLISRFSNSEGSYCERWEIEAIDCYLYAQRKISNK